MTVPEVALEEIVITIELVGDSIRIAEVTEVMVFPKMTEKLIIIEVTIVTELTKWMPFVGFVIRVSYSAMLSQLLASVYFPFKTKQLNMLHAKVAILQTMLFSYVVL